MDEKIRQYHKELTAVIEKFQEETHAGVLLKEALILFIIYTYESCYESCKDYDKAVEMIQELVDQHKEYYCGQKRTTFGSLP